MYMYLVGILHLKMITKYRFYLSIIEWLLVSYFDSKYLYKIKKKKSGLILHIPL